MRGEDGKGWGQANLGHVGYGFCSKGSGEPQESFSVVVRLGSDGGSLEAVDKSISSCQSGEG